MDSLAPSRRLARAAALVVPLAASACISTMPAPRVERDYAVWERADASLLVTDSGVWTVVEPTGLVGWSSERRLMTPWSSTVGSDRPVLQRAGSSSNTSLWTFDSEGSATELSPAMPVDGCTTMSWADLPNSPVAYCRRSDALHRAEVSGDRSLEWEVVTRLEPALAEFGAALVSEGEGYLVAAGQGGVFVVRDGTGVETTKVDGAPAGRRVRVDPADPLRFAVERSSPGPGVVSDCEVSSWSNPDATCESLDVNGPLLSYAFFRPGPQLRSALLLSGQAINSPDLLSIDREVRELSLESDRIPEFDDLTRAVMDTDGDGVDELVLFSDSSDPIVLFFDGDRTFAEVP